MPKKKPIDKRLKQLFQDIKPEEAPAESKRATRQRLDDGKVSKSVESKPVTQSTRPVEMVTRLSKAEPMSLAFQMGQNNWATLQVLDEAEGRRWTPDEQLLVKQVADQLSLALENAQLFQETQRRAQEMTALAEVGREISATLQLETVLERIATYAKDLLQAETSAVYLPEADSKAWKAISAVGEDAQEIKADPIKTGRGILGGIVVSKKGRIVNDASNDKSSVTVTGTSSKDFENVMGTPILSLDRVTGLMAVWRTGEGKEFTSTELDFLGSLAQQAAIAIENARLFQDTQRSESELRALFASMNDVIIVYDRNGCYVRIAPTNPSLLVRPPDEMIGRYISEIVSPELTRQFMEAIHEALDSDTTVRLEYPLNIAGNDLWFDASVSKLSEDQVFWVARDITDRKINELAQIAITQISESALSSKTLGELFSSIHESIRPLLPANNFYIAQYDPNTSLVTFPYYSDKIDDDWSPRKLGRGLTSYVIRTGKALRTTPEIFSDLEASGEIVSDGARSVDWLGVPLRSKQVVNGVIAIQTYDTTVRITEKHKEILSVLSPQVASAIERFLAEREIQKFKLGIDRSDNAVFITDLDGTIQYANPAFEKVYGYKPEEAIGKTPRILKSGLIPDEQYKHFWETLLSGGTVSGEIINKTKDGRIIPIAGTNTPILDETGKTIGFLAVHQDITERKQSEQALQRRNTYLAASSEIGRLVTSTLDLNTIFTRTVSLISERFGFYFAAIYIIDENGFTARLQEAKGEAGEKMKAQKHSAVVGSPTIVGKVAESGEPMLVNNVEQEPLHHPNPLLLDTHAEVAIPLRVGTRMVGVIDIQSTQENAFSQDDISVLQSLADQVAVAIDNARSYELSQQLIKDLREVDQLKSQFLANMSHELRTPLNSIIGFSRVIIKGIDGPITEMQNQDLTAIYNSGQHLLGLINDILDLARIEAGKMELNFEEVHLAEMVTSVMSTAKGLVKEKPIQLVSKVPADMPTVRGDTMRVRQVLINLLSNASKFTDEGTITVETHVQKGPTGKLEALISVIDTGPGISQEGQEKLFKAFSQVDGSATRKSGGSGLGLSICANLVQLHGGRISVHSEEGKGSTFWFTLPLFNQPTEEIPEGKKVVLAIDDDPQVISLYERYLNPQGYYVVSLTDPSKAKERILELKPFAVTLDIMMPNIDGWTVLTGLKSDPDTREFPIVICSIMEQADKGFSLGASDYLVKPILEDDLVHALNRLNKNGDIKEVLVIDDDPNDLRLIEKILNENGRYKPILAEGGKKGWELINQKTPSAIILDIFMTDMDGFTILEKMRENPILRDIPVLVVSGGGLTNEQHQQLNDFGQRLITKGSLKETELIANIENALNRISAQSG